MFGLDKFYQYYSIVIILQAICVIHSIRRGTQSRWIWIIVFLPFIGSIAYIFTEIIKKGHVSSVQRGVATLVNPTGKIKHLEKRFQFSNTFTNRIELADAYLEAGMHEKALELYEPALTGVFENNEHVIKKLIQIYYHQGKYEDIFRIAPKVSNAFDFSKSPASLMYTIALDKTGRADLAELEFKKLNHRFTNYEARYTYVAFLVRTNRMEEATAIVRDMLDETQHMNRQEKSNAKTWIAKAEQELDKISAGDN